MLARAGSTEGGREMRDVSALLIYTQADVFRRLGKQRALDCIEAKWLKPCAEKKTPKGAKKFYAPEDVLRCANRIKSGEYPGQ